MSKTTSGTMGSSPILTPAGFQPEQQKSLLSYANKLDPIMVFLWGASTMLPQWGFLAAPRYAAAAYFADPRESDFTAATTTTDAVTDLVPGLVEQHSQTDTRWRLWGLGLLAALLASWFHPRP